MQQITSAPKQVLIVDDDEAVLGMFTGILRNCGARGDVVQPVRGGEGPPVDGESPMC